MMVIVEPDSTSRAGGGDDLSGGVENVDHFERGIAVAMEIPVSSHNGNDMVTKLGHIHVPPGGHSERDETVLLLNWMKCVRLLRLMEDEWLC